jgi:phage baseplate assembly protein W
MMGMDERTGKVIKGKASVKQAVQRALRIRKGSRPMARWYGTDYLKQLGKPITAKSVVELTSDLAESIEGTIPGSRLDMITEQENGERLRVFMQLDAENITMDV